jgi:hypothetical protein
MRWRRLITWPARFILKLIKAAGFDGPLMKALLSGG